MSSSCSKFPPHLSNTLHWLCCWIYKLYSCSELLTLPRVHPTPCPMDMTIVSCAWKRTGNINRHLILYHSPARYDNHGVIIEVLSSRPLGFHHGANFGSGGLLHNLVALWFVVLEQNVLQEIIRRDSNIFWLNTKRWRLIGREEIGEYNDQVAWSGVDRETDNPIYIRGQWEEWNESSDLLLMRYDWLFPSEYE